MLTFNQLVRRFYFESKGMKAISGRVLCEMEIILRIFRLLLALCLLKLYS